MLSMSAADAPGKNVTIGAGVPRIPCTRPAGYYTPGHACSSHANNTRSSTCSPARNTSPSRSPGAPTRTSPGAYHDPNKIRGKALMQAEINTLTFTRVPRVLTELMTLGGTLKRRAGDILAYFDHPHTSNGPTEAINGRLEHLRGSALGLAKPHPLHHPSTPRNRRIQTPTTPPIMKSPGGCWQLCSPDVIAQNPARTVKTPPQILPGETGNLCIQNDVLMERMTGIEPA